MKLNAFTMAQVIAENVLPGTNIITDQWRAYSKALDTMLEMNHQTIINHSINFVALKTHTFILKILKNCVQDINTFEKEKRYFCRKAIRKSYSFLWKYNMPRRESINNLIISHNIITSIKYLIYSLKPEKIPIYHKKYFDQ
jgi:hypothetical protein